jgi:hypothetical protein
MNRALAYDYLTLSVSQIQQIIREMHLSFHRHKHETNLDFNTRLLTHIENEGKIRELEALVVQFK